MSQDRPSTPNGSSAVSLAVVQTQMEGVKEDLQRIEQGLSRIPDLFVSKAEFDPVKRIVYGLVSVVLVSVIGAVIGLVVTGTTG